MSLSDTYIKFNFIGNISENLQVYLLRNVQSKEFSDNSLIKINNELFEGENYIEEFDIFEKDKTDPLYSFRMSIYKGIINHINYDVNQKGPSSAIEMIFFGKNNIPNNIKYKDNYLTNFDNNDNKYRKRICFANVNLDELEYINEDKFKEFRNDSFQLIIRISENTSFQYTLAPIQKLEDEYNAVDNFNNPKNIYIGKEDLNILKSFCSDYRIFMECIINKIPDNNNDYKQYLEDLNFLVEKYDKIKTKNNLLQLHNYLLNPTKYNIYDNSLQIVHYSYILSEFINIYDDGKSIYNFFNFKDNMNIINKVELSFYEKLENDKSLNQENKINLLLAFTNICLKAILAKESIGDADYINIDKINKTNPYYKSTVLLNNIFSNLDEDSRLFEPFLLFDSGTIINNLEKNQKIEYSSKNCFGEVTDGAIEEFKTEFSVSLLNVNQVKKHLMKLIPKLIIRIQSPIKFRAYYDKNVNIMIINEEIMFRRTLEMMNLIYKGKDADNYIIPITMEILHEMDSHGKIRLINKEQLSPRYYRDSQDNFQVKSFLKKCTVNDQKIDIPFPESGRVLEYFISSNNLIISALKTPSKENTKFLDYKLWILDNFNYIEQQIKIESEKNLKAKNLLIDELDDDEDFDDCYIDRGNNYTI